MVGPGKSRPNGAVFLVGSVGVRVRWVGSAGWSLGLVR